MASPSRQIGDVSFVTNSNNNNHLKLFLHSESRGNMKTLTLSLASHIIVVCGVSLTLSTTALKSQPPHQLQVRGWPGATRPRTWFHLTQHFKLWVNYISLSAQVGILCVFLTDCVLFWQWRQWRRSGGWRPHRPTLDPCLVLRSFTHIFRWVRKFGKLIIGDISLK